MHDRFDWLGDVATTVITAKTDIGTAGAGTRAPICAESMLPQMADRAFVSRLAGVENEVQLLVGTLFRTARVAKLWVLAVLLEREHTRACNLCLQSKPSNLRPS